MKYIGSKMQYSDERMHDLQRVFDEYMSLHGYACRMTDAYNAIVRMPSRRFWVSPMRAAQVVSFLLKGDFKKLREMRPSKRRMYQEILYRVRGLQRRGHAQKSIYELCRIVVQQPAPEFYLAPGSAKLMICKARRRRCGEGILRRQHH